MGSHVSTINTLRKSMVDLKRMHFMNCKHCQKTSISQSMNLPLVEKILFAVSDGDHNV